MGFEFQRSRMCHSQTERRCAKRAKLAACAGQIRRSLIISGEGDWVLQVRKSRAADAEACADDTNDPKGKAEYQRIAESWRVRLGHFCGEVEAANTPRYAAL